MKRDPDFEHTLLGVLLDRELERFRKTLDNENPGLSGAEIERYMRAARLFSAQLVGSKPRTHGRKPRAKKI